ncbi:N(2)-fixation sustaining protein CowN [Marinospirillum perlucidum]|uniref:N(2)-fixation sustaining protein CowN n=1 Tax=Marinospirillum perlucidum TaxID=1982602 RepID=UPI000DF24F39|nr:N(2)-fixation sustaining protein CowN [Marinospirillum perlucidum]
MNTAEKTDRYVSFCGIDCDRKADELIGRLQEHLPQLPEGDNWKFYFKQKFEQQEKMQYDNLFYIGCQTNTLYEFFEYVQDKDGLALLAQIEEECC